MTQTLTTERLKDLTFHRSKLIFPASHEEAAAMASEILANREAQPLGYIDPANLKTYRGVMAGGSWSPVERTLSGLNLTLPIYLATPPAPAVVNPELTRDWIACSERLPETDGNYWGWWSDSKRQGPVWFTKGRYHDGFQSYEITHWMPLPAAPEGGNG
ncbi:TPA: DUF551 domain-containing protein [Serratia marcescens]|jgi:hypothetical protein